MDKRLHEIKASLILHPEWIGGVGYLRPHLDDSFDVIFDGGKSILKLCSLLGVDKSKLHIYSASNIEELRDKCNEVFMTMWDDWERDRAIEVASSDDPRGMLAEHELERESKWVKNQKESSFLDDAIEKSHNLRKGITTWIKTGNIVIDEIFSLDEGEINTIGAESGMGKTTLMIEVILVLIELNIKIAINSMEIQGDQLFIKMACQKYALNYKKVSRGQGSAYDYDKVDSFLKTIKDSGNVIIIYETNVVKLQQQVVLHKPKIVFNDFVNLFDKAGNTEDMGIIQYQLKAIAKMYKCSMINLAQMNKATGNNTGNIPALKNLQGAGATRQVSTVVIMLYYEGYYVKDANGDPISDILQLIVAKDRYGGTGSEEVEFKNGNMDITCWHNKYTSVEYVEAQKYMEKNNTEDTQEALRQVSQKPQIVMKQTVDEIGDVPF